MADDVMLTIRVPSKLRQDFRIALENIDSTPTEYLRGVIQDLVKEKFPVPTPEKMNTVKIAHMVLRGDYLPDLNDPKPGFPGAAATREETNKYYMNRLAAAVVKQDEFLKKIAGDISEHFENP